MEPAVVRAEFKPLFSKAAFNLTGHVRRNAFFVTCLVAVQGLRILFVGNLSEERFEVGVVPASLLSFGAEASF